MREHGITRAGYNVSGDLEFITIYTLFDITRTGVLKIYDPRIPAFIDDADQLVRNQTGAVLNHSMLFERKGVADLAQDQLKSWCQQRPLFHKVLNIRPKWGLDFSMDWVDRDGNAFEILHWEYDDFVFDEIAERKVRYQSRFLAMDWMDAGQQLLKRRSEWQHLDFFAQSDWKCNYFGIEKEQFKQVVW